MSVGARGAFKSQAQMKSAFMLLFRISSVAACYISTNSEKKLIKNVLNDAIKMCLGFYLVEISFGANATQQTHQSVYTHIQTAHDLSRF